MDGETNGGQEATQGAESTSQQQGQSQVSGDATDHEKQIAERNEKIASLEAQVPQRGRCQRRGQNARALARDRGPHRR